MTRTIREEYTIFQLRISLLPLWWFLGASPHVAVCMCRSSSHLGRRLHWGGHASHGCNNDVPLFFFHELVLSTYLRILFRVISHVFRRTLQQRSIIFLWRVESRSVSFTTQWNEGRVNQCRHSTPAKALKSWVHTAPLFALLSNLTSANPRLHIFISYFRSDHAQIVLAALSLFPVWWLHSTWYRQGRLRGYLYFSEAQSRLHRHQQWWSPQTFSARSI